MSGAKKLHEEVLEDYEEQITLYWYLDEPPSSILHWCVFRSKYHAEEAVKLLEDEKHQGWSNRETWAVALHLNNIQWIYNHWRALLRNIKKRKNDKQDAWDDKQFVKFTFEDELKAQVEEWIEAFYQGAFEHPDNIRDVRSMSEDVGSMWRVNWKEIAENFIAEYDQNG